MFTSICPHLRRFLCERNLLWRFELNLILCATSFKDYFRTRRSLAETKPYAINLAFDWNLTSEGYSFWSSVNRKWEINYAYLLSGGVIEPYTNKVTDDTKTNK